MITPVLHISNDLTNKNNKPNTQYSPQTIIFLYWEVRWENAEMKKSKNRKIEKSKIEIEKKIQCLKRGI